MFFLIINAFLYILLLSYTWRKTRLNPGTVLVGLWTIVALAAIIYYPTDSYFIGHITLWPLLYLFVTFYLFSRYVINYRMSNRIYELAFSRNRTIDIVCYVYVLCVIIDVISDGLSLQQIAFNNVVDNASEAYSDHFKDERVYPNIWIQLTHSYEYYVWYVALIAVFNYLCQGRRFLAVILLSIVLFKRLMDSVVLGERTFVVVYIFILLALFSIYHHHLDVKVKKILYYLSTIFGTLILSYLLAVSISRFDDADYGVGGSFLHYLGTPMLAFDYGIADSLKSTFGGAATFNGLLDRLGIPQIRDISASYSADTLLGTHIGSGFITFVGTLCLDFGFIFTFIIAVLWPVLMFKLCFVRGKLTYPGLYLFLFYFNRLSRGVFTTGYGAGVLYYQAFVFYIILWILTQMPSKKIRI